MRGYWWSPAGDALVVARVDDTPGAALAHRRPRAPRPGARPSSPTRRRARRTRRSAPRSSRLDGRRTPIRWTEEYLADVVWDDHGLLVVVQPRDQTALRALRVDPATGATTLDHERTDPVWVDIVPGVPAHTAAGALVTVADADGRAQARRRRRRRSRRRPCRCASVLDVEGDTVLLRASETPESVGLWTWGPGRARRRRTPGGRRAHRQAARRHAGWSPARTSTPTAPSRRSTAAGSVTTVASYAEPSGLVPRVTLLPRGRPPPAHRAAAAVLARARHPAAGAHGPLRRPARPARGRRAQRAPDQPVVRRPGVRRGRRRRAGHPGARPGVRARGARRPRRAGAGGPGRRAARGGRGAPRPRPVPGRHPRLVVRRVPRRAGRAAPPGRVPRRGRRRARHRLGALRHPLHGALPRPPRHRPGGVRAQLAASRGRRRSWSGRCCSCTASPTTTSWSHTRCGCPRRCSRPDDRTACCRCRGSRT